MELKLDSNLPRTISLLCLLWVITLQLRGASDRSEESSLPVSASSLLGGNIHSRAAPTVPSPLCCEKQRKMAQTKAQQPVKVVLTYRGTKAKFRNCGKQKTSDIFLQHWTSHHGNLCRASNLARKTLCSHEFDINCAAFYIWTLCEHPTNLGSRWKMCKYSTYSERRGVTTGKTKSALTGQISPKEYEALRMGCGACVTSWLLHMIYNTVILCGWKFQILLQREENSSTGLQTHHSSTP